MVIEKIGTSFAAPLVTKTLAWLRHSVTQPISRNLAKALLIQSAAIRGEPTTQAELPYRGFGIPGEAQNFLNCPEWGATLIFEPDFDPRLRIFNLQSFPIPKVFRGANGTVTGEFIMTLVYDPPLDVGAGLKYCRINVEAKIGTNDIGTDGKPHFNGQIPLEPADTREQYEKYQVEHGFKWSPVKVYRARFTKENPAEGQAWAIGLQMFYRGNEDFGQPQNVALVVTMQDPNKSLDVYNDTMRELSSNGWAIGDLQTRARLRLDGQA